MKWFQYIRDIWTAIVFGLNYLYEDCKLYKLNPCDVGCFGVLAPLGRALMVGASSCRCCSGTRILLVVIVMVAASPEHNSLLGAVILFGFIASALYQYYLSYRAKTWRFDHEV